LGFSIENDKKLKHIFSLAVKGWGYVFSIPLFFDLGNGTPFLIILKKMMFSV
jgi:hypothetical protein